HGDLRRQLAPGAGGGAAPLAPPALLRGLALCSVLLAPARGGATSPEVGLADRWAERAAVDPPLVGRQVRQLVLPHPCHERRHPALAGALVLACGPSGAPDRVIDLDTGQSAPIEPRGAFVLGDAGLYALDD